MSESSTSNSSPNTSGALLPRLILLASVCVIAGTILSGRPLQSANDRSRWATVWSLIHRSTWQIDEIDRDPQWSTIDKVRHRSAEDQPYHFYSSKPPLLSAMTAAIYGVGRRTAGIDLRRDPVTVSRGILLILNGIPMALALCLLQRLLARQDLSVATQSVVLLLAGLGSMVNPYLSTLNNHTPAVVSLLICLITIVRIQQFPDRLRSVDFSIVGLTAALTCCFELPAALFGVVSFVWMLRLDVRRTCWWYIPAAVLPLAAFFITNWLVTGGIRPFYAFYGTDKYVYTHLGVPSYWTHPQGLDANQESPLTYLFHCVLGHHGLLSHTPLLLLSVWGWVTMFRGSRRDGLRGILPVGAVLSAIVLCFYLSRTQNYNYGGNSAALRWMLWLTPFWWFALLEPLERMLATTRGFRLVCVLLGASIVTATLSLPSPWRPSWIYGAMSQAGWIDYRTPPEPLSVPGRSVIGSWDAPPGSTVGWVSADRPAEILSITVDGYSEDDGQRVCDITVQHRVSGQESVVPAVSCQVLLDVFAAGEPVEKWLRADPSAEGAGDPGRIVELLQGMPGDGTRAYSPSGIRWFQLTPNSQGYRCARAASRVKVSGTQVGDCWHRCDVWYCDEVPLGVLRWKRTVTQESTGAVIEVKTWTSDLAFQK